MTNKVETIVTAITNYLKAADKYGLPLAEAIQNVGNRYPLALIRSLEFILTSGQRYEV